MKKLIRGLLLITAVMLLSATANAKTLTRYTTQTVTLRDSRTGEAVQKVKSNTKVKQVRAGKVWARVRYDEKLYKIKKKYLVDRKAILKYTGSEFKRTGVIHWDDHKFTWYSQKALPGAKLRIPGRHVDKQGFVCDKWGYIVLGSNTANRWKIIPTPFGRFGKVYDAGWVGTYWFDVYTNF